MPRLVLSDNDRQMTFKVNYHKVKIIMNFTVQIYGVTWNIYAHAEAEISGISTCACTTCGRLQLAAGIKVTL